MKLLKITTLILYASIDTIQAAPRKNDKRKNIHQQIMDEILQEIEQLDGGVKIEYDSFGPIAPNDVPLGRPLLNDPNADLDDIRNPFTGMGGLGRLPMPVEGETIDQLVVSKENNEAKCNAPTYLSMCRLLTSERKYTFDKNANECIQYVHDNNPFCNALNTINIFDTLEECTSSCLVEDAPVVIAKTSFRRPNPLNFGRPVLSGDDGPQMRPILGGNGRNPFTSGWGGFKNNNNNNNFGNLSNNSNRFGFRKSGNNNNRNTRRSNLGKKKCDVKKSELGFCKAFGPIVWTFDNELNKCVSFRKSGCDTLTVNQFSSEISCIQTCLQ